MRTLPPCTMHSGRLDRSLRRSALFYPCHIHAKSTYTRRQHKWYCGAILPARRILEEKWRSCGSASNLPYCFDDPPSRGESLDLTFPHSARSAASRTHSTGLTSHAPLVVHPASLCQSELSLSFMLLRHQTSPSPQSYQPSIARRSEPIDILCAGYEAGELQHPRPSRHCHPAIVPAGVSHR